MIYVIIYLAAIVLANFSVLWFGPSSTIINAFLLIGLDLSLRDKLHDEWHGNNLWIKMMLLIISGSVITYLLNSDSAQIVIASVIAFASAAFIDTVVYSFLFKKKFLTRANSSNAASALADSILFPTIAFGTFMPLIILGQFIAKVAGGFLWSLLIQKLKTEPETT